MLNQKEQALDNAISLLEEAERELTNGLNYLKRSARIIRELNKRIAGNLESYAIPHIKEWLEYENSGGGETIPQVIELLKAYRLALLNPPDK